MKEKVNEKNVCDSAREVWTKKKKDKEEDVQRRRKIKKMKKKRESTCLQPSSLGRGDFEKFREKFRPFGIWQR